MVAFLVACLHRPRNYHGFSDDNGNAPRRSSWVGHPGPSRKSQRMGTGGYGGLENGWKRLASLGESGSHVSRLSRWINRRYCENEIVGFIAGQIIVLEIEPPREGGNPLAHRRGRAEAEPQAVIDGYILLHVVLHHGDTIRIGNRPVDQCFEPGVNR